MNSKSLLLCVPLAFCFHETFSFHVKFIPQTLGANNVRRFFSAANPVTSVEKDDSEARPKRTKLSRPERKALERARKAKASSQQDGNRKRQTSKVDSPELTAESTSEQVLTAIKRAQNSRDTAQLKRIAKLLLEKTNDSFMANGSQGSLLSRLTVAALRLNNHAIATDAISYRQNQFRNDMNPLESCAIVRNLLRAGNGTEAYQILEEELSLPMISTNEEETTETHCNLLKSRAQALASIASWHFFGGEPRAAVYACRMMCAMGPAVRQAEISGSELGVPFLRLLQGASQCQSKIRSGEIVNEAFLGPNSEKVSKLQVPCNVVYAVLDVMMTLPSENDDRVYEVLSNALVRRVLFVTGAVNMDGCPPPDRGEAAFIGRSNVGKSRLVNAVTNRKALAYTSKRPGKTQQFNFFAVNDKVGREQEIKYGDMVHGSKDADSFYMVDLPGFGYARVPEKQRKEWSSFMQEYIATRPTLRVLFHLIDSRHGPTEEDAAIMKQVEENIPPTAKYVIVLTKADKNSKGAPENYSGKVSNDVMSKLRQVMGETLQHDVPVVLTSAESKLGRDKMWSYLRRAAIS